MCAVLPDERKPNGENGNSDHLYEVERQMREATVMLDELIRGLGAKHAAVNEEKGYAPVASARGESEKAAMEVDKMM